MRIDILTILPQLLESPFSDSILKRAQDKQLVEVYLHDIRKFSTNKHKKIDFNAGTCSRFLTQTFGWYLENIIFCGKKKRQLCREHSEMLEPQIWKL